VSTSLPAPIAEAAEAALAGRLIVMPTDTVYGVGTRPDDPAATARVFEAKGRPRELALPVLVPTTASARRIAVFDERAEKLAAAFWPGALTIVLERTKTSRRWDLGGNERTIGVRRPHHPLTVALLAATGPLAVTSANSSGSPPATGCEALRDTFGERVSVYLCEPEPLVGAASTVVDLAHGEPRILRTGSVSSGAISSVIG
jgi:L-threonylcarbamoyladenylate synthase